MATKTAAEIRAQLDTQMKRLAGMKKGSSEAKAIYDRIIANRKLLGLPGTASFDQVYQSAKSGATQPAQSTPATGDRLVDQINLGKTAEKVINAQEVSSDKALAKNQLSQNASLQVNPFGQQDIEVDPVTGKVTQKTTLSGNQQNILTQGEQLTQTGQQIAQNRLSGLGGAFDPTLAQRTTTGDLNADRARIEEEVFGRLTRGLQDQKQSEKQQLEQNLFNRGIPVGSKLWNDQLKQFDERFDTQILDARAQAAQMGGEELARSFGINEQLIANQLSQQQGIRNQNLGEASTLQGMGTGLMTPQFTGYQGVEYKQPDVLGAYTGVQAAKQGKTALDIQREQIAAEKEMQAKALAQQAALANRGGGSSTVQSAFNSAPPQ